ncbi:MAG TPA: TlpA disulfide reductase family protein [Fimbriimonadaceae bacterium]|nr:TlpA disulfide reductase family protein [Fimbriimonadaceae bacterium]
MASPSAAEHILTVGDQAPPLHVGGWVKGAPVGRLEKDKLYVLEFWATWCKPCQESIPHLTELAQKYKGKVTFVGVSVREDEAPPRLSDYSIRVKQFVRAEGAKMNYHVAYDTRSGSMFHAWGKAAESTGVPIAFVVKKGRVDWIGVPADGLASVLRQEIAGTYQPHDAAGAILENQRATVAYHKVMAEYYKTYEAHDFKAYEPLVQKLEDVCTKFPSLKARLSQVEFHLLTWFDPDKAEALLEARATIDCMLSFSGMQAYLSGVESLKRDPAKAAYYAKLTIASGHAVVHSQVGLAIAYAQMGDTELATMEMNRAKATARKDGWKPEFVEQIDTEFKRESKVK